MFQLVPFKHNLLAQDERDFDSLFDWINRPVRNFFSNIPTIKTDIQDKENEYELIAELPGINKEDIHLSYKNNYLTISAKKDEEKNEKKYLHKERILKDISRTYYFDNVDYENISAKFDNGLLTINLPKVNDIKENEIVIN